MPTAKANVALLITDKFLKDNSHEDFESMPGYWSNLRGKLEQLLKSPRVANLHRWKTSPEAINAFCRLQTDNCINPVKLQQLAVEADQNGFFNMIADNPSVQEAVEHCETQFEYYDPDNGDWKHDGHTTEQDAATLLELAERLHESMPHLYWAYKIGLLN